MPRADRRPVARVTQSGGGQATGAGRGYGARPMTFRAGRRSTLTDAIAAVPDGTRVFVAQTCGTPFGLVDELARQADRFTRIEIVTGYALRPFATFALAAPDGPFHHRSTQPSGATRALAAAGRLGIVPARYSDLGRLFAPGSNLAVDVVLVQVSPPGPDGRHSLGVSVGASVDVIRTAKLVIASVNPQMPYTFGDGELPPEAFDHLVDLEEPVAEMVTPPPDETTLRVAANAADLVADGTTIQFGIGAMPEAVLARLATRRDLHVYSGMLANPCVELTESGVITGELVAAEAIGTRHLFDWVHRNPRVRLVRSASSHGAAALAQVPDLVGINSTIEIALDGSANSEVANGQVISGPGGAPDYAFGCDRTILAFPSTAAGGKVSRIVRRIEAPGRVTLPAYVADLVVTEYGVASLRGLAHEDRAVALAAIAHPDHRAALLG